jgi:hypothetical protein
MTCLSFNKILPGNRAVNSFRSAVSQVARVHDHIGVLDFIDFEDWCETAAKTLHFNPEQLDRFNAVMKDCRYFIEHEGIKIEEAIPTEADMADLDTTIGNLDDEHQPEGYAVLNHIWPRFEIAKEMSIIKSAPVLFVYSM